MIDAGKMRHVIRIEKRSTTQDAVGEPLNAWVPFATRRAEKLQTPGSEVWASQERQGRIPTVFKLRPLVVDELLVDVTLLLAMRLVCNNKVFDIVSAVDPLGDGTALLLTTTEHADGVP